MTYGRNMLLGLTAAVGLLTAMAGSADAEVTVTGTLGGTLGRIALVTMVVPIGATSPVVLKFGFVNQSSNNTQLTLCAATLAQIEAQNCKVLLGQSNGPTQVSLGVADINQLSGCFLYVIGTAGMPTTKFTVQME